MTPERKAEYHRTLDMLRRCAERQGDERPVLELEGWPVLAEMEIQWLNCDGVDGPITATIESDSGLALHLFTEQSLYLVWFSGSRAVGMMIGRLGRMLRVSRSERLTSASGCPPEA